MESNLQVYINKNNIDYTIINFKEISNPSINSITIIRFWIKKNPNENSMYTYKGETSQGKMHGKGQLYEKKT